MSVQVAKSTGNTTPTTQGRRTPLSLSGSKPVGKPSNNKLHRSSTDSEKDTANADTSSTTTTTTTVTATQSFKTVMKNDKTENSMTDLKKVNDKIGSDKKSINSETKTTTENTNNSSAKEKTNDDNKKKDDKKKENDSGKKDDKKKENPMNNGKESSQANGHKEIEKKIEKNIENNEKTIAVRKDETQKPKDVKDSKGKEQEIKDSKENKKASSVTTAVVEVKKSNENDSKQQGGLAMAKKKTEDTKDKPIDLIDSDEEIPIDVKKINKKEPPTPKRDEKKSKEIASIIPTPSLTKNVHQKPISNEVIFAAALTMEKDVKTTNHQQYSEDMESLVIDSESDTNTEPIETSTPGKILKIKQNPPSSVGGGGGLGKTYYDPRETYEKHKTINLRENKSNMSMSTSDTPMERPQFSASYRAISGRRSLRPIKDYNFQSTYRESYRKINTELDYTTTSMNVTVGSERSNESSFSFFGRGKKRERTPPVTSTNESQDSQIDIEISPKSPKRPRLDFSGIFDFVSSPVALLRAKLSRTKIQSSTPNGKVTSTTKDEEDGVENVSTIAIEEEMISDDNVDNSVDVKITADTADTADTAIEPLEKDIDDDFNDVVDVEDIEIGENIEVEDVKKSPIVAESMESINKRRMCNVM